MTARLKAALVVFVLLVAAVASAQVAQRTLAVHFANGTADVSYSAADFADAAVRRRLQTGTPQTLIMRTYAYAAGSTTPIAVTARSCVVRYDDWHGNYRVEVQMMSSSTAIVLGTLDEVVERCLVATQEPVGTAAIWSAQQGQPITFGVVVELNPLTPDGVQRMRQWVTRSGGGASHDDAFFGSFVSLFLNRGIADAERSLAFRSQEITCP
jgi:hypothetical protein